MSKAIVMHETGGPEVLQWEDRDPGAQAAGEVRIVHEAGCAHPILYRERDFAEAVREKTNSRGVDVVYDSAAGPLSPNRWNACGPWAPWIGRSPSRYLIRSGGQTAKKESDSVAKKCKHGIHDSTCTSFPVCRRALGRGRRI
ncbi:MAG: hypothetical protein ACOCWR_05475 [Oceanidesulfovibrio sp.]